MGTKHTFPVGMRNIKTALAVFVCLAIYWLIGRNDDFLAITSAIICMQSSVQLSVRTGISRLAGTAIGALWGLVLLYLNAFIPVANMTLVFASIGTSILIYLCNKIKQSDAIVMACIVFLAILLGYSEGDPFRYSMDRLIDTAMGIGVAVAINRFINPPRASRQQAEPSASAVNNITGAAAIAAPAVTGAPAPDLNHKERVTMFADVIDTIGFVEQADPQVGQAMRRELGRQRRNLELIASENLVSPAVMAAVGSVLTNKYAEGYPGKRYYGGCEFVDEVEVLAIERAKELFGAKFSNVQPHSGAQANEAVYTALLSHGDKVLGMSLAQGGHLTHGSPVNFSGLNYEIIAYGVDEKTHRIDYEQVRRLALAHKPKMIIAGASAYSREIDFKAFGEIAAECGAYLMVDMAHIAGLVAAGLHISPIPYAHVTTTTTHKTLRGIRGGAIFTNDAEIAQKINKAVFPGTQGGPLMHAIAAKAVAFGEALKADFKDYQKQVVANSKALAQALINNGFELVSGGTDNHLMLVDLTNLGITGKELEKRLDEVYITVNKNSIPNETRSPFVTSGIRIGTPAVTTRGLKEEDMEIIAQCIRMTATDFDTKADEIRATVNGLCAKYPLYE